MCVVSMSGLTLCFVLWSFLTRVTCGGTQLNINKTQLSSAEDRLYQKFFSSVRRGRPVVNASLPVTVNISFYLHQIDEIDEHSQTLTSRGSLRLEWFDEYINWDPDDFEGLKNIVTSINQIWIPKLAISNSIHPHSFYEPAQDKLAQVNADGRISWIIRDSFITSCAMSLSSFPFDQQTCEIVLADMFYTNHQVSTETAQDSVDLSHYTANNVWTLKHTTAANLTDNQNQKSMMVYSMTLKRTYQTAVAGIIIPMVCVAFLTLASFGTPNQTSEKTTIGMLTFVAYMILLAVVSEQIPLGAAEVPIIVIYMAVTCLIITLSIFCNNVVTKMHTYNPRSRLPRKLRDVLFGRLAWCLCMRHIIPDKSSYKLDHRLRQGSSFVNASVAVETPTPEKENVTTIRFELTQEGKIYNTLETLLQELRVITRRVQTLKDTEDSREEWRAAGRVLDRLFLFVFLIVNIVCVVAMLIIYPLAQS